MKMMTTTAAAALLALPFTLAQPALAQQSDDTQASDDTASSQTAETESGTEADPLIVTVGDTEITASDVTAAIASMPQQVQQTPPEQLVPFAVEQLVLRELILRDAEAQGISGEMSGNGDSMSSADSSGSSSASSDSNMSGDTSSTDTASGDSATMGDTSTESGSSDTASADSSAGSDTSSTDTASSDTGSDSMSGDDASSDTASSSSMSSDSGSTDTASSDGTSGSDTQSQSMDGSTDMASGSSDNMQTQMAQDNATIQAYLEQEMEGVVTDETVQSTYDELSADATGEVPPLDAIRPQIEQQLRQEKLNEIRTNLREQTEVVYYGPDGEPREEQPSDG